MLCLKNYILNDIISNKEVWEFLCYRIGRIFDEYAKKLHKNCTSRAKKLVNQWSTRSIRRPRQNKHSQTLKIKIFFKCRNSVVTKLTMLNIWALPNPPWLCHNNLDNFYSPFYFIKISNSYCNFVGKWSRIMTKIWRYYLNHYLQIIMSKMTYLQTLSSVTLLV